MGPARIAVHVTTKAGRNEVGEWSDDELSVRVTTVPEGGKANATVCSVVAKALGVSKSSVRVVRGKTSRHKLLEADGVDDQTARAILGPRAV